MIQGQRRHFNQRQNLNRKEIYQEERREFIPQQNMNQREEIYQMENREYTQQLNNNPNNINIGHGFCPVHGMYGYGHSHGKNQGNRFVQNQIYEQRQIRQEDNRNISLQPSLYDTHNQKDTILNAADNYKFYESKNIKNTEESSNCITLHYTRGVDEKEENSRGGSYYSNIYVATNSVPVVNDSKYQQFQVFSQSNTDYNNLAGGQAHIHSEHGFCPIHGNNIIQRRRQGY